MNEEARRKGTKPRAMAALRRLLDNEAPYRRRGVRLLAGVDEAGVGPLAGPVVAAAVILPEDSAIVGVNDSKRIAREEEREELACAIRAEAIAVGVGLAGPREIERVNIYQATRNAMARAVRRLRPQPDLVLVDARVVPGLSIPQEAHKKGDATFYQIACASLVAKTFRDALMRRMDARFPGYGFAVHKGYPTPAHKEAILRLGPCWIHRRTYRGVRREAEQQDLAEEWDVSPAAREKAGTPGD